MKSSSPSYKIVQAVARAEGVSPTDLSQPLYDVIDTDTIDALFTGGSPAVGPMRLSFEYEGYEVTLAGGEGVDVTVEVAPLSERQQENSSETSVESEG